MRLRRTRWEEGAACADVEDPEIFFEVENATDDERMPDPLKIAEALELCGGCPIVDRCFREAVYSRSLGIFGGTTAAERGIRYQLARRSDDDNGEVSRHRRRKSRGAHA